MIANQIDNLPAVRWRLLCEVFKNVIDKLAVLAAIDAVVMTSDHHHAAVAAPRDARDQVDEGSLLRLLDFRFLILEGLELRVEPLGMRVLDCTRDELGFDAERFK